MKQKLQILKGLNEAIELNPLGNEPFKYSSESMMKVGITTKSWFAWNLAEKNRRVFKIVRCDINCSPFESCICKQEGSIHECECNLEDLTCVIL